MLTTHMKSANAAAWKRRPSDCRILIAEDDVDLRSAIRETLLDQGFVVNAAGDGRTAVDLLESDEYDVLISDIRMPGLSGLDVARTSRSLPRRPGVILMTAFPEWFEGGYESGADFLLRKPFPLRVLLLRVVEVLRRREEDLS